MHAKRIGKKIASVPPSFNKNGGTTTVRKIKSIIGISPILFVAVYFALNSSYASSLRPTSVNILCGKGGPCEPVKGNPRCNADLPTISYFPTILDFPQGTPVTFAPAQISNVDFLTISPPLPPGLYFDPHTGVISGTPTTSVQEQVYSINAYNECDQSAAVGISITTLNFPPIG